MDDRDFEFWLEEAAKNRTRRQLETVENVRFGMWGKDEDYSRYVHEQQMKLMTPEEKKKVWDSAWGSINKIGRA